MFTDNTGPLRQLLLFSDETEDGEPESSQTKETIAFTIKDAPKTKSWQELLHWLTNG